VPAVIENLLAFAPFMRVGAFDANLSSKSKAG
jgi:hypothetical protein